jgi:hypothetical protein
MKYLLIIPILLFLTILYHWLPYSKFGNKKPIIKFFPKYKLKIDKEKISEIQKQLNSLGFKAKEDYIFCRGNILGDMSLNFAKIIVKFDRDYIYIKAGWIILFDTGDTWKLLKKIITTDQPA